MRESLGITNQLHLFSRRSEATESDGTGSNGRLVDMCRGDEQVRRETKCSPVKLATVKVKHSVVSIASPCQYSETATMGIHPLAFEVRLSHFHPHNARLQPRRLLRASAAVGGKPMLASTHTPNH